MSVIKKTLAELKIGDVLVGDDGTKWILASEKIASENKVFVSHKVLSEGGRWLSVGCINEQSGGGEYKLNVKAPESAESEPHIVEIDGKQIRVSLVDGQPVAELVKPELKPGSWVPLADAPDYTHVYIKALYANGRFANLSQNDELWSDHDSVPHVLIPPAIQTVGAHKSGDMVRLGDLPVGTRVISAVEDRLDRDESEETFVFGHWVDSDRKVELA